MWNVESLAGGINEEFLLGNDWEVGWRTWITFGILFCLDGGMGLRPYGGSR